MRMYATRLELLEMDSYSTHAVDLSALAELYAWRWRGTIADEGPSRRHCLWNVKEHWSFGGHVPIFSLYPALLTIILLCLSV